MSKLLILPSTTGQGDLAIAATAAEKLIHRFDVQTAYFSHNSHSPFLKTIAGDKILFAAEAHPDQSGNNAQHVSHLATEINRAAPDLVVALNEPTFVLSAVLANRPVIQLTHFLDPHLLRCGRKVLSASFLKIPGHISSGENSYPLRKIRKEHIIPLLHDLHGRKGVTAGRVIQKLKRSLIPRSRSRLHAELIDLYGPLLATAYLSQLFCDELVSHSVFPRDHAALDTLSDDRALLGRSPTLVTHSLAPPSIPACRSCSNPEPNRPRRILLTFGGIDHPLTKGFQRLLRILNAATDSFTAQELQLSIAGRVTETRKDLFRTAFNANRLFKTGGITILGSVSPEKHLNLMKQSDLVITQPGYSTLGELISVDKPVVLFYGLAGYYEQYANFIAANQSGLCVNPGRRPWLQVGEYGKYGSARWVREQTLTNQLTKVFHTLLNGKLQRPASRAQNGHYPHFLEALASRVDCVLRPAPSKASI